MSWHGLRGAEGALDAIERASAAGHDAQALLEEVAGHVRRVVAADAFFLSAADPDTGLTMGAGVLHEMPGEMCLPLWDHEFLVPDYNTFAAIAAGPRPVADLHEATGGRPSRSPRWRTMHAITGWDAEVRATFTADGATWGMAQFNRMAGEEPFSAAEIAWLGAIAPIVARGLRASLLDTPSAAGATRGPGVVVLDAAARVVSVNAEGEGWLRELDEPPPGGSRHGVPLSFRSIAEAVVVRVRSDDRPLARRARLRTRRGTWLVLHASHLPEAGGNAESIVLVIEPARASDVAPLIVEAYGLTPREVEVTRMIARGLATTEMAQRLHLSAHTVRDHVKAIFEKTGVSSRGELVAKVFAEHYLDGMHDAFDGAAARLPFATSPTAAR